LGEWILKKGKADLIAFARRLIADPEFPNKILSGRIKEIAPCTSCMTCISDVMMGNQIRCRINPRLGKEWKSSYSTATVKKKVIVAGGGPAGMEAAAVAAKRGHKVHLYEKNKKLGGLLLLASIIKGSETEDLQEIIDYYKYQMKVLGVGVSLGKAVDLSLIEELKPDVLVIATGGQHSTPKISWVNSNNVETSKTLKKKIMPFLQIFSPKLLSFLTKLWIPIGRKVVIVGGSIQGCETAEFLVKRGRQVSILEEDEQLGAGIPEAKRLRLIGWLRNKNVRLFTKTKIVAVSRQAVSLSTIGEKNMTMEMDQVIIINDTHPDNSLVKLPMHHVPEIYTVGDSENPGLIVDAVADGFRVGSSI
jgi:2,4-dienoyl-CoA reductase (NADPH2)